MRVVLSISTFSADKDSMKLQTTNEASFVSVFLHTLNLLSSLLLDCEELKDIKARCESSW